MSSYPIEQINKLADALEKMGFIMPDNQADDDSYSIGQMVQLANKFRSLGLAPADITKLGQHIDLCGLGGVLKGTHRVVPIEKSYLRDLYPSEEIELGPDDGTIILDNMKKLFSFFDPAFEKIKTPKQPAKKVRVCEIIESGKYINIFGLASGVPPGEITPREFIKKYREELRMICVGRGQINDFVVQHRDKLRKDGFVNLFLMEDEISSNFFLATVYLFDGKLDLYVNQFGLSGDLIPAYPHRVVVPDTAGFRIS